MGGLEARSTDEEIGSHLACDEQPLCLELFVFRFLVDAFLLQPVQLLFGEGVRQLALEQSLHQELLVGRVHAALGLVTSPNRRTSICTDGGGNHSHNRCEQLEKEEGVMAVNATTEHNI